MSEQMAGSQPNQPDPTPAPPGAAAGRAAGPPDDGRPLTDTTPLGDDGRLQVVEQNLRESQQMAHLALDAAGLGWGTFDLVRGTIEQDPRARAICGFAPDEPLTIDRFLTIIHPDDLALVRADMADRIDAGAATSLEYRIIRGDGQTRTIRGVSLLRHDDAGQPCHITGTLEDITDRRRNEETLRALTESLEARVAERTRALEAANAELTATRDRFSALFNTSPVPTVILEPDGGPCLDANPAFLDFLGMTRAEVIGRAPVELFHALPVLDNLETVRDEFARAGRVRDLEVTFTVRPGDERTILLSFVPLTLDGRDVLISTLSDFTERKRIDRLLTQQQQALASANAELAAARDHFRALFHANPVPSVILRIDDLAVVDANEAFLAFHGLPREQIVARSALELVAFPHGEDRQQLSTAYRHARGMRNQELVMRLGNGQERTVLVSDTPIYLEGARCTLATLIDITPRKQAEEQIRQFAGQLSLAEQAERQRIAAILHDDLQQRLFALQVRLASALAWAAKGDMAAAVAESEQMRGALAKAIDLTRRLTVDLSPPILHGEGLHHAVDWLASRMKEEYGLELTVNVVTGWRPLEEGMRVALFQIVRELTFNVVKHAGVSAASVTLAQNEQQVALVVRDAGVGFDATRAPAGGQGLRQARQRVELYGGHLTLDTRPGAGTAVAITVPLPASPA